jgi:hypothetical protein
MKKFLIIFIIFVFAGIGIAGFWYWQKNQYSKEILKLEILGPEAAKSGDEIEYKVKFKNNGKVRLEEVELIFEYPKQSIPLDSQFLRVTKEIEDIYPGEERIENFKARVFGKENDILEAKAWLSYRPKNLTARYESKTSFATQIRFVPLTFEFDLPLKVEKGEEIKFSLNYFSNVDYVLENLRVRIEYPEGFHFINSQPKALDETEWDLPQLTYADGGRIEIEGTIDGEEGTQKIFRAQLGMIRDGEFWLLKETAQSVQIIEPSLYISQLINGSHTYIANPGDILHYEIFFKNIGKKPIQKKFLLAKLEGEFFDLSTLKSEKGEIGRGDNSILWDWKEVPALRFLEAGEEGKVEFWVKVKEGIDKKIKNPILRNRITVAGTQKVFETKINSKIELVQKIYFQQEFWENSGPLPPKVGKTTTYTVIWQVKNYWNDLEKVRVKSKLSQNVKPTGKIFPEDAKFTFDSESGEVIWNIGELEAFQGDDGTPLTFAFQIEFTPDPSQKGKTPNLIEEAEILGEDTFTEEIIHEKADPVNTTLPDDETVSEEKGTIE